MLEVILQFREASVPDSLRPEASDFTQARERASHPKTGDILIKLVWKERLHHPMVAHITKVKPITLGLMLPLRWLRRWPELTNLGDAPCPWPILIWISEIVGRM